MHSLIYVDISELGLGLQLQTVVPRYIFSDLRALTDLFQCVGGNKTIPDRFLWLTVRV